MSDPVRARFAKWSGNSSELAKEVCALLADATVSERKVHYYGSQGILSKPVPTKLAAQSAPKRLYTQRHLLEMSAAIVLSNSGWTLRKIADVMPTLDDEQLIAIITPALPDGSDVVARQDGAEPTFVPNEDNAALRQQAKAVLSTLTRAAVVNSTTAPAKASRQPPPRRGLLMPSPAPARQMLFGAAQDNQPDLLCDAMTAGASAPESAPLGGNEALTYHEAGWLTLIASGPVPGSADAIDTALDRVRAALHADLTAKRGPFSR